MTPEQKSYVKNIAIAVLGGAVAGGVVTQFASEPPTLGKLLLGGIVGGGLTGAGMGFYLRTGGDPEATFAALPRGINRMWQRGPNVGATIVSRSAARSGVSGVRGCPTCAPLGATAYEMQHFNRIHELGNRGVTKMAGLGTCWDVVPK